MNKTGSGRQPEDFEEFLRIAFQRTGNERFLFVCPVHDLVDIKALNGECSFETEFFDKQQKKLSEKKGVVSE